MKGKTRWQTYFSISLRALTMMGVHYRYLKEVFGMNAVYHIVGDEFVILLEGKASAEIEQRFKSSISLWRSTTANKSLDISSHFPRVWRFIIASVMTAIVLCSLMPRINMTWIKQATIRSSAKRNRIRLRRNDINGHPHRRTYHTCHIRPLLHK